MPMLVPVVPKIESSLLKVEKRQGTTVAWGQYSNRRKPSFQMTCMAGSSRKLSIWLATPTLKREKQLMCRQHWTERQDYFQDRYDPETTVLASLATPLVVHGL